MFDVPQIQLGALRCLLDHRTASVAVHLRPPRDAGAHLMTQHVKGNLLAIHERLLVDHGARPYDAHVASEHVEELGQLVDAELANEATEPRLSLVLVLREGRHGTVGHAHAAKLEHLELLAVSTGTRLLEQYGTWARDLDGDGGEEQQPREEHDDRPAHDDVGSALDRGVEREVERHASHVDDLDATYRIHLRLTWNDVAVERNERDGDAALVGSVGYILDAGIVFRLERDDYFHSFRFGDDRVKVRNVSQVFSEKRAILSDSFLIRMRIIWDHIANDMLETRSACADNVSVTLRDFAVSNHDDGGEVLPLLSLSVEELKGEPFLEQNERSGKNVEEEQGETAHVIQMQRIEHRSENKNAYRVDDEDPFSHEANAPQIDRAVHLCERIGGNDDASVQQKREDARVMQERQGIGTQASQGVERSHVSRGDDEIACNNERNVGQRKEEVEDVPLP